jgi:hypothetical protein
MPLDPADGGYMSRKMIMAYVSIALGTAGYVAASRWPSLSTVYSEYCMF